jgi:hypothetical protein
MTLSLFRHLGMRLLSAPRAGPSVSVLSNLNVTISVIIVPFLTV